MCRNAFCVRMFVCRWYQFYFCSSPFCLMLMLRWWEFWTSVAISNLWEKWCGWLGIRYKYMCTQTILFSPTKRCHFLCCHSWRFLRQLCHFQNSYKMTWLEERFMVVLECIFVTALLFKICRCCHGNRSCCSLTCFFIMFFTLVLNYYFLLVLIYFHHQSTKVSMFHYVCVW